MKALALTLGIIAFICLPSYAQEKLPIKFGKVSPAEFDLSKYNIDTSANAVIIADVGSTSFEGNQKGSFSLLFKRQMRIKILNKNGMDAADFHIPLYTADVASNGEEKLENLKAYTYNLENGKVVETKLESSQVFKDKINKNHVVKKFTMPAVKEGAIIEVTYTVQSDFLFNLRAWEFQGNYPALWSEYQTNIPEYFNYVTIGQGYQPFFIKKTTQNQSTFTVTIPGGASASERITLNGIVYSNRWVMKDVPAMKIENYTSTLDNHICKIEFQLSEYRYPNQASHPVMATWVKVREDLMKDEDFGMQLYKNNNWLDEDMKTITAGAKDTLDKMVRIYNYVKNNFTCTVHSGKYLTGSSLKTVWKNKSGNVADINLMLTAMLSHEGVSVYPVLLSTRSNGFTHEMYPLLDRFNYVIACAMVGEGRLFMDASDPLLGFGRLQSACYNGHARILSEYPEPIYLEADSIKENKLTSVFMTANKDGKIEGSFNSTLGYYESLSLRGAIKDKGQEEYFKKIKTAYGSDWNIRQAGIDSLKVLDEPVTLHYEFSLANNDEDIIYLNPMMNEGYKENPFASADRKYPVEMPYSFDKTYVLNIDVPENYVVDELPKSSKISFNDGEGYFEYLFSQSGNLVQMRSRVVLNKTNFLPEEYQSLRDFFSYVVKKESEQIVLKKKK